jgi:hypothetical protein
MEGLLEECIVVARESGYVSRVAHALNDLACAALIRNDPERAVVLLDESLAVASELDDLDHRSYALGNLGWAWLLLQDVQRAAPFFAEEVAIGHKAGQGRHCAEGIVGLAAVAAAEGRALRAARLYGAGSGFREAVGLSPWAVERTVQELDERQLREELGDSAFAAAFAEGRAMTREQAIAEALELDSSP